MKQIIENIRSGELSVADVPAPLVQPGHVLIANAASVISAGTEKMVMELAKKSLLGKARERPDHVRRVLEKVRQEGLIPTIQAVRTKLDEPMKMGYASAGIVLAVGEGVREFQPGDRVASNGPHAEVVCVPKHLCARVPENVGWDQAAFTVLASIALQGIRLSRCVLGESVLVIGLGLVGQLAVALTRAAGCRVIGTDPDPAKCKLALKMGADLAKPGLSASRVEEATYGLGADAVLITASTASNGPIELAAQAVRAKGRIVLIGVVGLELDRRPFYFKEAEFVVSCSYGPGRYDPSYEEAGRDYPAAHVRWTEQRNLQSVLDLMGSGGLDVAPLISHRFPISRAGEAYDLIESNSEPYLGIVLEYPERHPDQAKTGSGETTRLRIEAHRTASRTPSSGRMGIGVLGVGNFARTTLLPAILARPEFEPIALCSATGMTAAHHGRTLGFAEASTDEDAVLEDPRIGAVFIVTRHHLHSAQVLKAIRAGKHVFVEKPLCLTLGELHEIEQALIDAGESAPSIMVGFNRRFAPATRLVHDFFRDVAAPLTVSVRFNAGPIPADHWTQDPEVGGGRLIGEACHGIDLATHLAGAAPIRLHAESIGGPTAPAITEDQTFITLRHANGAISSVAYLAGGSKRFPKERVEVIGGGRIAVIEDFRTVITCSDRDGMKTRKLGSQDKGHRAQIAAWAESLVTGSPPPIPWPELRAASEAAIIAGATTRAMSPTHDPNHESARDEHLAHPAIR